ncbi:MAG: hypothetical protein V7K56_26360 [Nostoc sp.]
MGSSAKTILGWLTKARAITTRCPRSHFSVSVSGLSLINPTSMRSSLRSGNS